MKPFLRPRRVALPILLTALVTSVYATMSHADEDQTNAVTPERIAALSVAQRQPWLDYLKRSKTNLENDQATLAAEVKAAGLKEAIPAPYPVPSGPRVPEGVSADWYSSPAGKAFMEAILSFQIPNGGWSKNLGFNAGTRKPGGHWTTSVENWYYVGTFDNGATIGPMMALARAYDATKDPRYAASFNRGLDYIFAAQFPNGGWPQVYPLIGWYHDEVTFNDNAMTRVVGLLRDVASEKPEYSFVDPERRARARAAEKAGLACILKCQVVQNGQPTAWCAQHDPLTLAPAAARKFELASLSGWESADIVDFLMGYDKPTPDIQKAVEGAVAWFKATKITGYEIVSGKNAVGGVTFALKANPEAPPIWARFYELGTNRPIFSDRQSHVFYSLSDLDQSGPGRGYHWYVTQPKKLLEINYPKWRQAWFPNQA